ncbi:MAG: hypothetical protein ACE366_19855 [Bradymonadia bacterium]
MRKTLPLISLPLISLPSLLLALSGCDDGANSDTSTPTPDAGIEQADATPTAPDAEIAMGPQIRPAPESPQRVGDPEAGWNYLIYGDYLGSGVPYDLYMEFIGPSSSNILGRTGEAAEIPATFNVFDVDIDGTPVKVVSGITCLGCHASFINGEFIPGLGDAFSDFTANGGFGSTGTFRALDTLVTQRYGADSPEWKAYEHASLGVQGVGDTALVPFFGPNGAALLEKGLAAHRDPDDLTWIDEAQWDKVIDGSNGVGSDVPPWWNVKKKTALYYSGMGRGDHTKLLMQIALGGLRDAEHAAQILEHFDDVFAWLRELQPPAFPGEVDAALAAEGMLVFESTCSGCHGTYGATDADDTYPNVLVPFEIVGTDPTYAQQFIWGEEQVAWYNDGWFGQALYPSEVIPEPVYLAPPLDGVWATAPYLHNGSVPTLAALLDSSTRPTHWRRADYNPRTAQYDLEQLGWPHEAVTAEEMEAFGDALTYDTTELGYSNEGHTFGDALTDEERLALLEYLKTL